MNEEIKVKVTKELARLNEDQRAAATHNLGPALVLAGAGSGKTKVLTTRAAWLMAEGLAASTQILLVTFTNKAAAEMRRRVYALTGSNLEFSGTFHSLCAKILRKHAPKLRLSYGFTIYDGDDQLTLLKNIYKSEGWDVKEYKPASILGAISRAKNNLQTPSDYEEAAEGNFASFVARAYKIYQHHLKQEDAVDFDDLLNYVVWLFRDYPEVRGFYQDQIKYVLVDEYQDTNKAQYLLTKYLTAPENNLMAVGDFSQSIYAWRGADYKNMMYLEHDFPELKKYYLEQNYRSLQPILSAATQVIEKNSEHPILDLWTERTEEMKIGVLEAATSQQEAAEVAKMIDRMHREEDVNLNDIVILYRVNAQSRAFEEALARFGVPYKLVGGFKFYERKEVKDLLCYLRILINPKDSVSLTRATKIGKRRLAKFETWREQRNEKMRELGQDESLGKPYDLLKEIIEVTAYRDFFEKDDPEDIARWENVEELLNAASMFDESAAFLENVALIQDDYMADADKENRENRDEVTMMSLHSAKGLEYTAVFMVGMEEGLLPHSRALYDASELEEERRLCYVGITRAKERLHLSYARQRYQYGEVTMSQKSRFISDIDRELLETRVIEDDYTEGMRGGWGGGKGWFEGGEGWGSSWGNDGGKRRKNGGGQLEKKLEGERKIVIDEGLIDDLLRDDIDITEFLKS